MKSSSNLYKNLREAQINAHRVHTKKIDETFSIRSWRKRVEKAENETHIFPKETCFAWCKKKRGTSKTYFPDLLSVKAVPERMDNAINISGGLEIVISNGKKSKTKPFDATLVLRPAYQKVSQRNVKVKMYEHEGGKTFLEVVGQEGSSKYSLHCFF